MTVSVRTKQINYTEWFSRSSKCFHVFVECVVYQKSIQGESNRKQIFVYIIIQKGNIKQILLTFLYIVSILYITYI